MYWPLGTPRIYATSSTRQPTFPRIVSHDGLPTDDRSEQRLDRNSFLSPGSAAVPDGFGNTPASSSATAPLTPVTPVTPLTPGIKPVEHDYYGETSPYNAPGPVAASIPLHEPIVALGVARPGHIFAVITATSMTIWQTKVREFAPGCCRVLSLSDRLASQPSSLPSSSAPNPLLRPTAPIPICCCVPTRPSSLSTRAWDI